MGSVMRVAPRSGLATAAAGSAAAPGGCGSPAGGAGKTPGTGTPGGASAGFCANTEALARKRKPNVRERDMEKNRKDEMNGVRLVSAALRALILWLDGLGRRRGLILLLLRHGSGRGWGHNAWPRLADGLLAILRNWLGHGHGGLAWRRGGLRRCGGC